MAHLLSSLGDYRVEISGWGLDSAFFVEQTDLLWTTSGDKRIQLHRALPQGAIVFVRLLSSESSNNSVPVPYQIDGVEAMDCNGRCHMTLKQLRGRSKESSIGAVASKCSEEPRDRMNENESEQRLQREEVLQ